MFRINFSFKKGFWITSWVAKRLYEHRGECLDESLDLGLGRARVCVSREGFLETPWGYVELKPLLDLNDKIALASRGGVEVIARWCENGFYKLKAIHPYKAPTLEINGIHMHRVSSVEPWVDAKLKVIDARVRRGDVVFDTCMGLGYTAIHSILRGASLVKTVEVDENVIWIVERNPWSKMLSSEKIVAVKNDVVKQVDKEEDSSYTKIIHDPPRLTSSTGELYSLDFYRELYRILKPGGILYHYTGEPGRHRASIVKGVGDRLRKAGFKVLKYSEKSMGYIAVKPRF